MSIPTTELRRLLQKSGNRCAFPGCIEELTVETDDAEGLVNLGVVAHIVADKPDGPRGQCPLAPEDRNKESNLLLLCRKHHEIVDAKPATYTVQRLRRMKADHERLIREASGRAVEQRSSVREEKYVRETLFSTLLPVIRMPRFIYGVECDYDDMQGHEVAKQVVRGVDGAEMYPFIVRGHKLYCFQNLRYKGGPFRRLVGTRTVERFEAREWWDASDRERWFVSLLNRALNKLTGRKGLNLDKRHHRYYFVPEVSGQPLEVSYRPLNQSIATRQVVWQPITRKTGLPKPYWYHRAIGLHFHRASAQGWFLSMRPEMHVTQDGLVPMASEYVGTRVTRKKARMYNYDLLAEVQFWRDYLSGGEPRIILPFGKGQYIAIGTTMMQTEVEWPGMPEEHQKMFGNAEYWDDLWSWAAWKRLDDDFEEAGDWEEADEDEEP